MKFKDFKKNSMVWIFAVVVVLVAGYFVQGSLFSTFVGSEVGKTCDYADDGGRCAYTVVLDDGEGMAKYTAQMDFDKLPNGQFSTPIKVTPFATENFNSDYGSYNFLSEVNAYKPEFFQHGVAALKVDYVFDVVPMAEANARLMYDEGQKYSYTSNGLVTCYTATNCPSDTIIRFDTLNNYAYINNIRTYYYMSGFQAATSHTEHSRLYTEAQIYDNLMFYHARVSQNSELGDVYISYDDNFKTYTSYRKYGYPSNIGYGIGIGVTENVGLLTGERTSKIVTKDMAQEINKVCGRPLNNDRCVTEVYFNSDTVGQIHMNEEFMEIVAIADIPPSAIPIDPETAVQCYKCSDEDDLESQEFEGQCDTGWVTELTSCDVEIIFVPCYQCVNADLKSQDFQDVCPTDWFDAAPTCVVEPEPEPDPVTPIKCSQCDGTYIVSETHDTSCDTGWTLAATFDKSSCDVNVDVPIVFSQCSDDSVVIETQYGECNTDWELASTFDKTSCDRGFFGGIISSADENPTVTIIIIVAVLGIIGFFITKKNEPRYY